MMCCQATVTNLMGLLLALIDQREIPKASHRRLADSLHPRKVRGLYITTFLLSRLLTSLLHVV